FNTCARQEIMLPSGAPDPAGIDQIVSAGHITGDGRPDMFATAGTTLWAFTGYTGGSFSSATALNTGSAWSSRDIISVGDMTGDGVADMIYRTLVSGKLYLRQGSAATTGVDLGSLATGSASANKADSVYSDSGWDAGTVSRTLGTPDVTGDGIPDLWAQMTSDGSVRLYTGGKATLSTTYTTVIGSWTGKVAFG
ncbi:MAG: hypothetical protein QOI83_2653, partial [Streptomycetaceae bacterium]|nr:hypothetical protein [Streptomycetaceae bacterium]